MGAIGLSHVSCAAPLLCCLLLTVGAPPAARASSPSRSLQQYLSHAAVDSALERLASVRESSEAPLSPAGDGAVAGAASPAGGGWSLAPDAIANTASTEGLPAVPPDATIPTFGECATAADCSGSRMFCLDGQCRCPILFPGGKNCDQPRKPVEPWCLTPLKDWPAKGPKYTIRGYQRSPATGELTMNQTKEKLPTNFATCAVVGSSGSMSKSILGAEISRHTAIVRFNEAPTRRKYAEDVGSWTTLRFQNRDRSGFADYPGEICVVRDGKWSPGMTSGGRCVFKQLPSVVESYFDRHFKTYPGGPPAKQNSFFSNGWSGVVAALHMCARVDVYGMQQGQGYYFVKYAGPAKSWGRRGGYIGPPNKPFEMRHAWAKERSCLDRLAKELPGQFVLHPTAQNS